MSWENRFSDIVKETEKNIATLQKRLANYTCPLIDDSLGKGLKPCPCPKIPTPYFHPIPCYSPVPCGPCPPASTVTASEEKSVKEINGLKLQIKSLQVENEMQKKRASHAADTVLELAETFCPNQQQQVFQQQQQTQVFQQQQQVSTQQQQIVQQATQQQQILPQAAQTPTQYVNHQCIEALGVKDMVQSLKIELRQQIANLQTQIVGQNDRIASLASPYNNIPSLQKEISDIRQYVTEFKSLFEKTFNTEFKSLSEQVTKLRSNIESTKTTVDAIEANRMGLDEGRKMKVVMPAPKIGVGSPPKSGFGSELKDTICSMKDQIGLLEEYVRNRKERGVKTEKMNESLDYKTYQGRNIGQEATSYQRSAALSKDFKKTIDDLHPVIYAPRTTGIDWKSTNMATAATNKSEYVTSMYKNSMKTTDISNRQSAQPSLSDKQTVLNHSKGNQICPRCQQPIRPDLLSKSSYNPDISPAHINTPLYCRCNVTIRYN